MNQVFDWCVDFLYWLSDVFGMTYKEINVWIFVIIWPLIFIIQWIYIVHLKKKIQKIKNRNTPG
ncbi:hypothetical protein E4S40_10390 [Algoriphagus kandeliae]|uniref:Uncharacterized protein n=1 Tax=Algoriphagus kandeliae TaxID=2562278 RepID=A0A4Y9QTC7_9BACT|nr:hypothetical protein [Algoriphagus kandeliae]TFV94423.1 hypothetical protein E4S40_10390 [Algoriphagus kandeliae]